MRAWLLVVAALAVAPCRATAAQPHPDPARLDRIKSQILAKLGLTSRPTPLGAPPRDVVRQILARAADPHPHTPHNQDNEHAMREVIAIAHRGTDVRDCRLEALGRLKLVSTKTDLFEQVKEDRRELRLGVIRDAESTAFLRETTNRVDQLLKERDDQINHVAT